jgi:hypothetical protein
MKSRWESTVISCNLPTNDAILRKRQMKSGLRKSPSQRRWRNTAAVVTLIAGIVGPSAAVAQTGVPCAALADRTIDPKLIGLPSGAASVTSALRG